MNIAAWIRGVVAAVSFSGVVVLAETNAVSEKTEATEGAAASHAIQSMDYNAETKVLTLGFKRGAYTYEDVPAEIYEGLKNSDSKGTYFKENIRGKFKTTKVGAN